MIFNVLLVMVILNTLATIVLWRTAMRKPEKPKKNFITALLRSNPKTDRQKLSEKRFHLWSVTLYDLLAALSTKPF